MDIFVCPCRVFTCQTCVFECRVFFFCTECLFLCASDVNVFLRIGAVFLEVLNMKPEPKS